MNTPLPPAFRALDDLTADWVLASEEERMLKRYQTPYEEQVVFYERVMELLPEILGYLSEVKPTDMSPADAELLGLTRTLAEVSIAVEKIKAPRAFATYAGERIQFYH